MGCTHTAPWGTSVGWVWGGFCKHTLTLQLLCSVSPQQPSAATCDHLLHGPAKQHFFKHPCILAAGVCSCHVSKGAWFLCRSHCYNIPLAYLWRYGT